MRTRVQLIGTYALYATEFMFSWALDHRFLCKGREPRFMLAHGHHEINLHFIFFCLFSRGCCCHVCSVNLWHDPWHGPIESGTDGICGRITWTNQSMKSTTTMTSESCTIRNSIWAKSDNWSGYLCATVAHWTSTISSEAIQVYIFALRQTAKAAKA